MYKIKKKISSYIAEHIINKLKTAFQLCPVAVHPEATKPINTPWIEAPTLPVPSIIPVTVAVNVKSPFKLGCVPKSAETAVVINAYGPLTNAPHTNIIIILIPSDESPTDAEI